MLAVFGTVWADGQGDGQLDGRGDQHQHPGGHHAEKGSAEQNSEFGGGHS